MTSTDLGLEVIPHREHSKSRPGLIFVIAMWFVSRSVIAIGMQIIAPLVCKNPPVYTIRPPLGFVSGFLPKSGWELFSHWDGKWYVEFWVEQRYDTSAAKWTTSVLAWCPFSLFCTVIYTEGLFLFLTASALRAFERGEYIWAAVWGALTTATRGPGLALIPTFLLTAWREKRPPIAYAAGLASAIGFFSFSLYCAIGFGDALAFFHVQKA